MKPTRDVGILFPPVASRNLWAALAHGVGGKIALGFRAMDNKICSLNVDTPQILPAWPFLDSHGAAIFVSQMQPTEDWEPRGLPPWERTKASRRVADFSIRSILALEGSERERGDPEEPAGHAIVERGRRIPPYPWISSSRFKPPFVPSKATSAGLGEPHKLPPPHPSIHGGPRGPPLLKDG